MVDLIDLIRVVCKATESKKAQFHDEIKKRGWRGLRADSTLKVLGMLNGKMMELKSIQRSYMPKYQILKTQ